MNIQTRHHTVFLPEGFTHHAFGLATALIALSGVALSTQTWAQQPQAPPTQADKKQPPPPPEDPFADVPQPEPPEQQTSQGASSWTQRFFHENFGFRKEIMSQFDSSDGQGASRQSVGFEMLKKFSTKTATVASVDVQGRVVRRDGFNPVLNDMEGEDREGWAFEYHNLYVDLYNVLNPVLSASERATNLGRFNLRAGRFYLPFGLNLQTDTHGSVLQLSNDRNFGFERDWYAGLWGRLNSHVNYDAHYLVGSGYDLAYKGQSGLGAVRLSLGNQYSADYGLEGGMSFIAGERLSSGDEQANGQRAGEPSRVITTRRAGVDARYRHAVPTGLITFTTEVSAGQDRPDAVSMQLYQGEYLHRSRRWRVASQYRRFHEDARGIDNSLIGDVTYYFRNDVGNSNLHWITLNVERQIQRVGGSPQTVVTLQYYFYR